MRITVSKIIDSLPSGKLNVFVSGGFDSCVLAYTIAQYRDFEICTVPRYDDSIVHATRISEWLTSKFQKQFKINVVGDPDQPHHQQVVSGIVEAITSDANAFIVLADTSNPPVNLIGEAPQRTRSTHRRVFQPFFDYHKDAVILLAKDLGVLDEVSTITHTCTQSKLLRCASCWQCHERQWAFRVNELIDIGKM